MKTERTSAILVLAFGLGLAANASDQLLQEGRLVGYWSFDVVEGDVVHDSSGSENHGTLVGDPQWTESPEGLGGALQFNGESYVEIPNNEVFDITDAITLAAWIKVPVDGFDRDWQTIFCRGDWSWRLARNSFEGHNNQSISFHMSGMHEGWGANGAMTVTDGEWHHVAGTWDGSWAKIYFDGILDDDQPRIGAIGVEGDDPVTIGAQIHSGELRRQFIGCIDDVRIYNYALSATEVRELSEGTIPIIGKVEDALNGIKRYHLRMEMDDPLGYVSESEVDVENKAKRSIIQIGLEAPREVEFYWIGEQGYGLPRHIGTWFRVWVPGEPMSRLNAIFAILKTGEVTSVREEHLADERCWVLSVTPDLSLLRSNAQEYAEDFSPAPGEGSESYNEELRTQLEEAFNEAEMQAEFWVSQETHYIKKAIVTTSVLGAESQMIYHISNINDPALQISPPAETLEAEGPPMSLALLFTHLKGFRSGWCEYNHCWMTAEALKLIKKEDTDGKYPDDVYSEIYEFQGKSIKPPYYSIDDPKQNAKPSLNDAPVVQGAWAEDAGENERIEFVTKSAASDITVRTFRDYRHFGGQDKGLEWKYYFELRSTDSVTVTKPKNGVRYMSAKDWGKKGEDGDKMNFQGAIEAYNHYTDVGQKEAYYRMGHVLHLLQDQAQPDHAKLAAHPSSAKTQAEAYDKFYVCFAEAANIFEIEMVICRVGCGFAAFGYVPCLGLCEAGALVVALTTYGVCKGSIDSDQVGFERLVKDHWDFDDRVGVRQKLKIKDEASYDDYFKNVANDSIAAISILPSNAQKIPLGLDSAYAGLLTAGAFKIKGYSVKPYSDVPGIKPNIDSDDPKQTEPYLKLADSVIVMGTNRCAGLLQHFYDIVNYPPYVESVIVAQGAYGLSPADVLAKPQNFIYSAWWKDELVNSKFGPKTKISGRTLVITQGEPISKAKLLSTARIYVVAQVRGKMKQLALELKDCYGASIDKCTMKDVTSSFSAYDGTSYFADFAVPIVHSGISKACDVLALDFTGEDAEAHFSNRSYSGKELDSNPGTVAMAGNVSPYNWTGYGPGADKNHRIRVISADINENNNVLASATPIVHPSGWTPLKPYLLYDFTLHDSGDIDFFLLQLPAKTKEHSDCEKAQKLPKDVVKLPGSLTISVEAVDCRGGPYLSGGLPTVTLYRKNGTQFTQSEIPVIKTPDGAEASLNHQKIETYLHDGKGNYSVIFSIKAESGKRICYDLGIGHHWCLLRKILPPLFYDISGVKILGLLPDPWPDPWPLPWPDPWPGPGPEPPEPPWPFPYPATPGNIELVSEGGIPEPEYFILQRSLTGKFQIDIEIRTPTLSGSLDFLLLDSMGEVLAEAEEFNPQLLSGLSEQSCDVCTRQLGESSLPQTEYPRWKRITMDSLEAGTYLLEVSGTNIPLPTFYSLEIASAMVVDDFELYTDDLGNRIFETWLDGRGYPEPAPGYPGNGTGSTVGHAQAPFAEQTIVHGGYQSMPFGYDNTGGDDEARYSETQREWALPQDWAQGDAKALTLWFYGDPNNAAEQLYVAVEDSNGMFAVMYHPELESVQASLWQEWNIDLQELSDAGVNLASVRTMRIGLGNLVSPQAGGTGTIYIDDIRLRTELDCFPDYHEDYPEWIATGRPNCWCYPRQCHGDADGKSQGKKKYWVSTDDLDVLIAAWNKPLELLSGNEICADFDQLPQGKKQYRVSTDDLDILIANWQIANGPAPDCP
jgi:hypothetical protein